MSLQDIRKRGFHDAEIVQQLISKEISKRSYALQRFHETISSDYASSTRVCQILSQPDPWTTTPTKEITAGTLTNLRGNYEAYDYTPTAHLVHPFSPALELWYRMGGKNLYNRTDQAESVLNRDPQAWKTINARKN